MNEAEEKLILEQKLETKKMKARVNAATAEFKLKSAEFRLDIAVKFADYGEHSKSEEHSREAVFETALALAAVDDFSPPDNHALINHILKNHSEKEFMKGGLAAILAGYESVAEDAAEASGKNSAQIARERIRNAAEFLDAVRKHISSNLSDAGGLQSE